MGATPYVGLAATAVFLAVILVPFGYAVGRARGRRAGMIWFVGVLVASALTAAAMLFMAASSGQLGAFLAEFGINPLLEISVFALLMLMITGFPTLRGIMDMER